MVFQFNIALVWNQFMLVVINSEFVTFYVEIQISYQDSTVPYRKWNNGMKKLKCCHMPFYIHYGPVFIKVLACAYVYSLCSCVYQSVVMCLCIFIMFLCLSKCYHMPMYINCVPVFIMSIYRLMVNFQQYISYMVAVSFIGGGNQRTWSKPLTGCKSLTD